VRIAGLSVGQVEAINIDGDHVVMKFSAGSNTIGTESRLAIKTDTILGKKVLEIEPRGHPDVAAQWHVAARAKHHAVSDYDAFFDVTKAAAGWGHRHRQTVAECVVADHRSDLSAPECGPRRGGQVLRHHRQA